MNDCMNCRLNFKGGQAVMNINKYGAIMKVFTILVGCTLGLFIALGIGGMLQSKWVSSPISSMKGLASTLSNHFFVDMVAMELPSTKQETEQDFTFSGENVASFLFRFMTDVQFDDPKSLIAMEVPGLSTERAYMLRGKNHDGSSPFDYTPSQDHLQPHEHEEDLNGQTPDQPSEPDQPEPDTSTTEQLPAPVNKSVFVYHSHNRESWIPELDGVTELNDAYDPVINITKLGERMVNK